MKKQKASVFPDLATDRLILRRLVRDDAPQIFKLRSDDRVNLYLDRPKSTTIDEALNFIGKIEKGIKSGESYYWAIALKDEDKLIGTICLWNIDTKNSGIEIGFELLPELQGQGLMYEAVTKVIEYAFATLKFKMITACLKSGNQKSINLLEKARFAWNPIIEEAYRRTEDFTGMTVYSLNAPGAQ